MHNFSFFDDEIIFVCAVVRETDCKFRFSTDADIYHGCASETIDEVMIKVKKPQNAVNVKERYFFK